MSEYHCIRLSICTQKLQDVFFSLTLTFLHHLSLDVFESAGVLVYVNHKQMQILTVFMLKIYYLFIMFRLCSMFVRLSLVYNKCCLDWFCYLMQWHSDVFVCLWSPNTFWGHCRAGKTTVLLEKKVSGCVWRQSRLPS